MLDKKLYRKTKDGIERLKANNLIKCDKERHEYKMSLLEIKKIANNALYFNDGSDYKTALWEILGELGVEAKYSGELKYIED